MKPSFQLFSSTHIAAIVACILAMILLVYYAKNYKDKHNRRRDVWIFTIVFVLIEMALIGSKIVGNEWSVQYNLPLHLCDISAITILIALHTRSKKAFELGYYWGFVGGLMAILTPNLQFVDWYFVPFFVWHLFLIAGPMYQLFADDFNLTYKSIYKTAVATILLGCAMFCFNLWLGSNYMFVNQKISSFDALGLPDFPMYLPYMVLIGIVMFHLAWSVSKLLKKN